MAIRTITNSSTACRTNHHEPCQHGRQHTTQSSTANPAFMSMPAKYFLHWVTPCQISRSCNRRIPPTIFMVGSFLASIQLRLSVLSNFRSHRLGPSPKPHNILTGQNINSHSSFLQIGASASLHASVPFYRSISSEWLIRTWRSGKTARISNRPPNASMYSASAPTLTSERYSILDTSRC